MIKKTVSIILGIIAVMCLLPWIIGIESNIWAVTLGVFIIIGLILYLFLGREARAP